VSGTRHTRSQQLYEPPSLVLPPGLHVRTVQDVHMRAEAPPDRPGTLGSFDGYACRWGVQDTYGTTFLRGCFETAGLDADPYPFLWLHSPYDVLGAFTAAEDAEGLRIAGWWDDTPLGQQARARALSGSAPELSVGFGSCAFRDEAETELVAVQLREVSQVTLRWASQPGAALAGVRTSSDPGALEAKAAAAAAALRLATAPRVRG
jgi:HK97 family phage prohead protease